MTHPTSPKSCRRSPFSHLLSALAGPQTHNLRTGGFANMMTDDPMTLREKISFYLVDCETPPGKAIDVGLVLINLLACVLYVVSTFPLSPAAERVLRGVEIAMVTVFAVEYVLRLWVAEKKLRYVFSFYAVVDLLDPGHMPK